MEFYNVIFITTLIKTVLIFASYGYASISDYIKREINPLVWIPPIVLGIAINIHLSKHIINILSYHAELLKIHLTLSIVVSIIIIVLTSVLSFILGLMGGADVLAMVAFTSIYPANMEILYAIISRGLTISNRLFIVLLLPSVIIILLLYLIVLILLVITNIIYNITHIDRIKCIQVSLHKKLIYVLFGRAVKIKDLTSKRFYYPIYVPGIVERITFNIDEDYMLWIEKLKNMDQETVVVVTWGIPMVTFISVAVYVYTICCIMLLIL